jgi:hypothetical protein
MWPIALPQTKVVHLLRLAWATVDVSVNQSETSQGNAIIQSGCESQLYQSVSAAYPKRIRQRDGNESAAVSSVSAAYPKRIQSEHVKGMETNRLRYQAYRLRIQSEYVKGMETNQLRYQAYRLRIGCVSKRNPRCVLTFSTKQEHDIVRERIMRGDFEYGDEIVIDIPEFFRVEAVVLTPYHSEAYFPS